MARGTIYESVLWAVLEDEVRCLLKKPGAAPPLPAEEPVEDYLSSRPPFLSGLGSPVTIQDSGQTYVAAAPTVVRAAAAPPPATPPIEAAPVQPASVAAVELAPEAVQPPPDSPLSSLFKQKAGAEDAPEPEEAIAEAAAGGSSLLGGLFSAARPAEPPPQADPALAATLHGGLLSRRLITAERAKPVEPDPPATEAEPSVASQPEDLVATPAEDPRLPAATTPGWSRVIRSTVAAEREPSPTLAEEAAPRWRIVQHEDDEFNEPRETPPVRSEIALQRVRLQPPIEFTAHKGYSLALLHAQLNIGWTELISHAAYCHVQGWLLDAESGFALTGRGHRYLRGVHRRRYDALMAGRLIPADAPILGRTPFARNIRVAPVEEVPAPAAEG